ncbi:hypothetical protein [Burkholderia savannae]|uniref:hypothetical protein n=2 Tax=Burkholderiaceae TaxID=119060 RepID=UPI000A99E47D|nr:hypothetical protein [Burkholderia savannae]
MRCRRRLISVRCARSTWIGWTWPTPRATAAARRPFHASFGELIVTLLNGWAKEGGRRAFLGELGCRRPREIRIRARQVRDECRPARAMISSPDTIAAGRSIGACYGDASAHAKALFERIGTRVVELGSEAPFDALTALGPCLPIALAYCDAAGYRGVRRRCVRMRGRVRARRLARRSRLGAACGRVLSVSETQTCLSRAATPAGITEAILRAPSLRKRLPDALREGVRHGAAMARHWRVGSRGGACTQDLKKNRIVTR